MEALRQALLDLHKALIESERVVIERVEGRLTAAQLWQRLVEDPALAWLGALSSLIVRLDEGLAREDEASLRTSVHELLAADAGDTDFHRRYGIHLQENPDVVLAHHAVARALG